MSTDLQGVKGWLLFFVITVAILNPLALVGDFVLNFDQIAPQTLILCFVWDIGLAIYCIITGINLWRVSKGALRQGRIWLGVMLGTGIILTILSGNPVALIRSIVYFGIWMTYLYKSSRVANTYRIREAT